MKYLLLIIISMLSLNFYGQIKTDAKQPRKSIADSLYENMSSEIKAVRKVRADSLNELIEKYSKLIEQNPKDDEAYYMRANAKQNLANYIDDATLADNYKKRKLIYQDEINDLIEVTKLDSKYADTAYFKIYSRRTMIWQGIKDSTDKSSYYLEKAVALNPKYTIAWVHLANLYYNYNNDKRAIECYTKVIELKDTLFAIGVYQKRAQCKRNLKDYKGAIADLTNATKVHRTHFNFYNIYFDRGLTKYEIHDYKGAIEDYTKAIDLVPKYTMYYYYRGNAKFKAADKQGACLDWSKAKNKEMIDRKWVYVTDTISKYCK
jgi:tetratricopeptide (TPR) repeat protein